MLQMLKNVTYRNLFAAQIIALLGTGLATVALALTAYDLAGDKAGQVLGTALAIKMLSYVLIGPIGAAFSQKFNRKHWLITMDLIRASVALSLPWVSEIWQVYILIFILQSASAGFTPAYQAILPEVLPKEADYTRALSLSRLAYDLESLTSPAFAALLLTVLSTGDLFMGTALGFVGSAVLIFISTLPPAAPSRGDFRARLTTGLNIYLRTPRLRGLLGLSMTAAAISSVVFVNTVVIIRSDLGLDEESLGIALACFGMGSICAALLLPHLLKTHSDRAIMCLGAALSIAALLGFTWASREAATFTALLVTWCAVGFGYSSILTPAGRLLRRSASEADRPAVFAAQFTLSHACWLLCYPLAGLTMSYLGLGAMLLCLAAVALAGLGAGLRSWPKDDPETLLHDHPDLPSDHPHLRGAQTHSHAVVIDQLHPHYPTARRA